jgi:1,2-diacylglycerol 3-alpha-glucosyltransferase
MKAINSILPEDKKNIRFILADIDDTMTEDGLLLPEAFSAIWDCYRAGIHVIPVTGRPAGWCDLIARQWPVAGVIGENGAFAFYTDNNILQRMYHPSVERENVENLEKIRTAVLENVPGTRISKDQFCRMFDLAIDFAEEEPKLSLEEANNIKILCESYGATAKISSIHVNTWYGTYDKLSMSLFFLEKIWKIDKEDSKRTVVFCGDSPNDAPMFKFFPLSCGVGNIKEFEKYLEYEPQFITTAWYGKGFSELVDVILSI